MIRVQWANENDMVEMYVGEPGKASVRHDINATEAVELATELLICARTIMRKEAK